jgi:hypothetical protein
MRGKLAKILRLTLIGRHSDVAKERASRSYVWATEMRKGVEKKICISASPARRAYKQFKEAYTHGGESKREMRKDIKRVAGIYRELHGKGVDRQVLSSNPTLLLDPLKS